MAFIGVITNQKNEEYIKRILCRNLQTNHMILFISDKNIDNMKNIKFETIMIDKNIKSKKELKTMISNSKYLILNSDLNPELDVLENLNLTIITYGFNNKATLSISSISENSIMICLQRIVKTVEEKKYEPQEFEINKPESMEVNSLIGTIGILLTYGKSEFK